MANTFKLYIGGKTNLAAADDYTSSIIRCEYKKNFCNDYQFDAIIDGVQKGVDTELLQNNNVFFVINDGTNNYLLFKGIITESTWSNAYRCQIRGIQCMRDSSGSNGTLQGKKVPQLTAIADMSLDDMLTSSTWYDAASAYKDNGESGEGKNIRGW